jgi:hypothetical protein
MNNDFVSSSFKPFYEYTLHTWEYLVAKQDELILIQTIITIFAVFIAIYEIRRWKIQHVRERESNYYFDLLTKVEDLRFQVLVLCTPKFLQAHKNEDTEREKTILLDEIKSLSFAIEKEIGIIEKISKSKSDFKKLYQAKIGEPIVRELSMETYGFRKTDKKDPLLPPPSKTEQQTIQNEFIPKVNMNFEVVISALSKKLI